MAEITEYLNLEKPLGTESVSRTQINSNWQKIDDAFGQIVEDGLGACGYINVSTITESYKGKTVMCTGAHETLESTFDNNGHCNFKTRYIGQYTLECQERTTVVNVTDIGAVYEAAVNEQYVRIDLVASADETKNQTVHISKDGTEIATVQFSDTTATYYILNTGTYLFSVVGTDEQTYSEELVISQIDDSTKTVELGLKIVTWHDGSWTEIGKMLEAHYKGKIDIAEYWSEGDVREGIPLTAMTGSPEAHAAQNIDLIIIGIKHDNLKTPIHGVTKAAITVHMKNNLIENGKINTNYNSYTYARYTTSERHTWIANTFIPALPEELRNLLKVVTKKSVYPSDGSNTNTIDTSDETAFLLSNWEIFGAAYSSLVTSQDGDQYKYYETQANRIKNTNGSAMHWWSRSGYWDGGYAFFVVCDASGGASNNGANYGFGLALGFCL